MPCTAGRKAGSHLLSPVSVNISISARKASLRRQSPRREIEHFWKLKRIIRADTVATGRGRVGECLGWETEAECLLGGVGCDSVTTRAKRRIDAGAARCHFGPM